MVVAVKELCCTKYHLEQESIIVHNMNSEVGQTEDSHLQHNEKCHGFVHVILAIFTHITLQVIMKCGRNKFVLCIQMLSEHLLIQACKGH